MSEGRHGQKTHGPPARRRDTAESRRLADGEAGWKRSGPYVSERAWGTVREDYSEHGEAWDHLPHDHARSRAYRWSEDGLGGICDEGQVLCLAFSFWNGKDPILKERIFGLPIRHADGAPGDAATAAKLTVFFTPSGSRSAGRS